MPFGFDPLKRNAMIDAYPDEEDKIEPGDPGRPVLLLGPLLDDLLVPQEPSGHLFHEGEGDVGEVLQNALELFLGEDHEAGLFDRSTLADLGSPVSRAISPKLSPGPNTERSVSKPAASFLKTLTFPDRTT